MATTGGPAVSGEAAEQTLDALQRLLGPDRVQRSEAELRAWRDPFQFATSEEFTASGVVMPETVEEIQAILRVANERRVPLWTHSQGRNNGYGGPAPRVRDSVIVSLRNMNRVLEIDAECAYALVEPGVRWFDLYEAIVAGGHRLMLSIADLGWGSVIGNTLDHGLTYMPYGMDQGMQCGMEVVLANGDVMRTGMGALPGSRAWNVYKRGLGPTPDQLFMQSNFGIVTKMGVWLMPYPETYLPLWVRVPRDEDLAALIDTLRRLMLDGTIRMVPQVINTALYAAMVSDRETWWAQDGPIPEAVLDRMGRELECGRWLLRCALYGDEPVVDHRFAKIKAAFAAIDGAEVWGAKHSPEDVPQLENPHERVQGGVPNLELNAMVAWYGGQEGGHIGFSPIAPLTGHDAVAVRDLLRRMLNEAGLDYMASLLPVSARSFSHITMVIFDTKDEQQVDAAYAVCRRLVVKAAELGYGEYRAHLDFMDLAAEQYSFGDHAQRRFNETIKDALDPNGILSPGKQGIWPAGMRPA